jgi:predicted DNA-binding protein with PD1-like motif
MKYIEANQGRVFVLRLEDGDTVHEEIENFAREHDITAAALVAVGGAAAGSTLVVGPEQGNARPVKPMAYLLDSVHEIAGTGTLFPDEGGNPMLHMHMACGRGDHAVTGCIRSGVTVWTVMEVVLFELVGTSALRVFEPDVGFKLLKL